MSETDFDVIVIGAGVNGAGVARDASMRGLSVLVLDKGDLGGGTSAWSTRLIHGGLRYLEHGELRLVRESLRERETLLRRLAPHLVRPLPMLIPVYEGRRRGPLTISAGMVAYDLLSFDKTVARHRTLSREKAISLAPGLGTDSLRGAALYMDAQVEFPERLVVENALAARAHGATVRTHARVKRIIVEAGRARGVEFTDLLSGGTHEARAGVVVNASGPWVDEVLRGTGPPGERLIGGTKGTHVVVEPFDGAPSCALYAEAGEDGRPFFVIPWNDRFLIGTTDTRFEGDLDRVEATEDEIAYLLAETNRLIPSALLTRESVLYTYAGVRPLPFAPAGATGAVTRRHFTRDHAPEIENFFSIVGGKLTTYRSLSDRAVKLIFKKLGRRAPACETAAKPLPGASLPTGQTFEEFAAAFAGESDLPERTARRLLRIYGVRAASVLRLAREDDELLAPLGRSTDAIAAEIPFAFREEMAETLTDCLMRRTMLGLNSALGLDTVEAAAAVARKFLSWNEERACKEVNFFREYVRRFRPRAV